MCRGKRLLVCHRNIVLDKVVAVVAFWKERLNLRPHSDEFYFIAHYLRTTVHFYVVQYNCEQ